jgi:hypothetical protein
MNNSNAVGKIIIIKDLNFSDYMKDKDGNIKTYDSVEQADLECGMYEFPDVLICQIVSNHVEEDIETI